MADETKTNNAVQTEVETEQSSNQEVNEQETERNIDVNLDNTEIAKLKSEIARQKAALDKATKEASETKKALRAKLSEEERLADEKREADEAKDKELADLRKRFAVAENSKKIFAFTGDESVSNSVAEYLYGAEDVDAAIDALNKAWIAREKKLKVEYGKIPAPGIGAKDSPSITKEQLDAMTYTERVEFSNKYTEEYNKLMGR